jgi:hypothetical protein
MVERYRDPLSDPARPYRLDNTLASQAVKHQNNQLRGLQAASELYRLGDRHLSATTFADRGASRGQRGGSPTVVNLSFLDRSRYFSFK